MDKKDIQDLIAVKVQLSKEEWKKEMMTLREELERQIELHKVKDEKAGKSGSMKKNGRSRSIK